jgi:hypothetical protein
MSMTTARTILVLFALSSCLLFLFECLIVGLPLHAHLLVFPILAMAIAQLISRSQERQQRGS